jgi:hypothetical protein
MLPTCNPYGLLIKSAHKIAAKVPTRTILSSTRRFMSDLRVDLIAPNGVKYSQPTGLFINNEWVRSSDGGKIASINPTYVLSRDSNSDIWVPAGAKKADCPNILSNFFTANSIIGMRQELLQFMQRQRMM